MIIVGYAKIIFREHLEYRKKIIGSSEITIF